MIFRNKLRYVHNSNIYKEDDHTNTHTKTIEKSK